MENQRKLELTLCGMLPYGLKISNEYNKNEVSELTGVKGETYFIKSNDKLPFGDINSSLPHLHSLSKLTKPILDGWLIPIVELFKISRGNYQMEISDRYIDIVSSNEVQIELGYRLYNFGIYSFYECDVRFGFNYFFETYFTDLRHDNKEIDKVYCQNILFEKLKEWHFNIYDLPSDMYIEKSEIKKEV